MFEINHETLSIQFESMSKPSDSFMFYKTIRDCEKIDIDIEYGDLGKIDFYLKVEGGPRTVAYINRKGMLITASREIKTNPFRPRKAFPRDYTAVVTPSTDQGDKYIRSMENPSHSQISYKKIKNPTAANQASKILKQVRDDISEIITNNMQISISASDNLNELASLLPEMKGVFSSEIIPDSAGNNLLLNVKPHNPQPKNTPGYSDPGDHPEDPVIPPEPNPKPEPVPVPPRPFPNPNPRPGPKVVRKIINLSLIHI